MRGAKVRNSPIARRVDVAYTETSHIPWGGTVMQFAVFSLVWFSVSVLAVLTLV